MKQESRIQLLIASVYMTFVYLLIGICVNTAAASYSMEFYENHRMLFMFLSAGITIPICLLQMRREGYLERKSSQKHRVSDWIFLMVLGISSCIALNYWITMSGLMEIFHGFDEVAENIYGGNLLEEILAVALAAPIVEELLFRGLAYRGFKRLCSQKTAMLLSALFFGVYHRNLVQGLYAFLIGLLLVWVYEVFGTLWASVLFHISANAVSVFMTECLDMSFLERYRYGELVFTLFFTITGIISFLLLFRGRDGRNENILTGGENFEQRV